MTRSDAGKGRRLLIAALVVLAAAGTALFTSGAGAGTIGPDVTVHFLSGTSNYGNVGGIRAYSVGTTSCNTGDTPLNWCDQASGCAPGVTSAEHPVIAQNIYRLKDNRFQQIGMGWLKHGFTALANSDAQCGDGSCAPPPFGGNQLGVGCTDPYGSSLNGSQPLGLKSEVNASTGIFVWPRTNVGFSTAIDQRIQVLQTDLEPTPTTTRYFIEGHYIARDDAQFGNALNNASWREVTVNSGTFNLSLSGSTMRLQPAIMAWPTIDPTVEVMAVDVPASPVERFYLARKVIDLGGGVWHYEYALHNLNSDRSARSFTVEFPSGATITNAGTAQINHHSGEPFATTAWTIDTATPGQVSWFTDTHATNANANALRWASMFNFWFDATSPPGGTTVHTIGLFKPGTPTELTAQFWTPVFLDGFESGNTSAWSLTVP
ncbi:MAG TPA: hypothetical protein VF017_20730 [Thermoanaerobaculia bacterium]|nr:hypothetical protein [Thermoanaerobaculia bacterium]